MNDNMKTLRLMFLPLALGLSLGLAGCAQKADVGSLPIKILNGKDAGIEELLADEEGNFEFSIPVGYIPKNGVIDFNASLNTTPACSKYYVAEFKAGKTWYKGDMFMCSGKESGAGQHPTVIMQTFRMPEAIKDELQIRLRPTGQEKADTAAGNAGRAAMHYAGGYVGEYVQYFGTAVPKDTLNILCIGNSFTYVCGVANMLKEIAWNEGHLLKIKASLKGGRTFGQHFELPLSRNVANAGHYDYAFMQDHSQNPAKYGRDTVEFANVNADFIKLSDRVISRSPDCRIFLEATWAYSNYDYGTCGTYEAFDSLMTVGAEHMVRNASAAFPETKFAVSPIGKAFTVVRNERPDLKIYSDDNHHQSEYGAYLKACVNYLVLFGEEFHSEPAEGALTSVDCGLPHETAEYLRHVAESVVLQ